MTESATPAIHRRRTQAERSAETIELLIAATVSTIAELGYHRATTAEISARAGVTEGALFHHFDTRIDLVLAALGRMTEQRIDRYIELADEVTTSRGSPLDLLRVLDELGRDDVAVVWAELTMAARTDADLRQQVQPAIDSRWALIRAAATAFPGLAAMEERPREVWLQLLRGIIVLAPLVEPLTAGSGRAGLDDARNKALIRLAEHLGARFPAD